MRLVVGSLESQDNQVQSEETFYPIERHLHKDAMKYQRMTGRTTLVTGGGTGIGKAIAKLLAEHGSKIVIAGRRRRPLEDTVREIVDAGGDGSFFCADVSALDEVDKLIDFTLQKYGTVDTLVNAAGVIRRVEEVVETREEEWEWQVNINLKGIFHTTKACLPSMMKGKKGSIINIASICASTAIPGYATYSATKGGVVAYTRVIAVQYASHGIRANSISPGMVHTPMSYVDRPNFDDSVESLIESSYPIKRLCLPEDIAYAALYLASDEASYVTGHDLVVDGGFTIR